MARLTVRPTRDGPRPRLPRPPPARGGERFWVTARDGRHFLGSPIDVAAITATVGCVSGKDGGLTGWAWHPGDPNVDPVLTIRPARGRGRITITASDADVRIDNSGLLGRPRGFTVPAAALRGLERIAACAGPRRQGPAGQPARPTSRTGSRRRRGRHAGPTLSGRRRTRPSASDRAGGDTSGDDAPADDARRVATAAAGRCGGAGAWRRRAHARLPRQRAGRPAAAEPADRDRRRLAGAGAGRGAGCAGRTAAHHADPPPAQPGLRRQRECRHACRRRARRRAAEQRHAGCARLAGGAARGRLRRGRHRHRDAALQRRDDPELSRPGRRQRRAGPRRRRPASTAPRDG